jgi:hypothetical protein
MMKHRLRLKIISIPCIRAGTTIAAVASSDFLKMGNEVKEKTERERERESLALGSF